MYEELLDRLLQQLNQLLPHDVADILLLKEGVVRSVRWRGYDRFGLDDSIKTVTYHLDETANLRVIQQTGRPLAIPNVEQFDQWVSKPGLSWIKSQASAPIRIGDRVIGFLNINSATPGVYTQTEAEKLQAFADHAAVTLQNARLQSYARQVSLKRQKTEKTLQETLLLIERAKREWETTVDALSQLVSLVDHDGRVVRANWTVARWGLAKVTQVKGKSFHELLHPGCTDPDCYLKAFWSQSVAQLVQGHPVEIETHDQVMKRHLNLQIRPIGTGQGAGINGSSPNFAVIVVTDVTTRKRTEEELRQSQVKNQALLNAIPDLMLQIDRDGILRDVLPAKEVALPLPPGDVIGKQVTEIFSPKGAEEILFHIKQALLTGKTQTFEYQQLVAEKMRDYEVRLVVSSDDELLLLVRDITKRKQTEAELERYRNHLEEIIEERSVMLLKANEKLEEEVVKRKQVEEQLVRRNKELALLNHILISTAGGLGLETLLQTTCRELALTLSLSQARAILLDETKREANIVAQYSACHQPDQDSANNILVDDDPTVKYLLQQRDPLVVDNARLRSEPALEPVYEKMLREGISSLLMLPLFIEEDIVGTLSVASTEPHHYSEEEINLARVVSDRLSEALAQS
jgi:PAS domain S-box-containing protein